MSMEIRIADILQKEPRLSGHDTETAVALGYAAAEAKTKAYCPYSKFRVGAAVLTSDDLTVQGCNVENASYPVTVCAERVALPTAVAAGHRKFKMLAVSTDIQSPASPCGMCRQFINEFCPKEMPIIMLGKGDWNGKWEIKTLGELLPMSFGPQDLPPALGGP